MNVHKIDAGRNYSIASARHAGIDNATERKLEHHITTSQTSLARFHEVDAAQTGLVSRCSSASLRTAISEPLLGRRKGDIGAYPKRLTPSSVVGITKG